MKDTKKIMGKARRPVLVFFDIFCFAIVDTLYYVGSRLFSPTIAYTPNSYILSSVVLLLLMLVIRFVLGVYNNIWRYTSTSVYFKAMMSDFFSGIVSVFFCRLCGTYESFWFFLIVASFADMVFLLSRFVYRMLYRQYNVLSNPNDSKINIAIVGAGQLGAYLANELIYNPSSIYNPVFFIDNDSAKIRSRVTGLMVYANNDAVLDKIHEYNVREVFIAISNMSSDEAATLFEFYSRSQCKIKVYDTPVRDYQKNDEPEKMRRTIREFQIEDLLFRKPIAFIGTDAFDFYTGKTILVTGGGGSIGSELCRQIAGCKPKRLIIFDIYENNAYDIQQELIRKYDTSLDLAVEIGSVRDRERLECVFRAYRPDVVFHAAAHKHVPLMEHSACESIKNNVLGTYNTADMAEKYGTKKFILISTDKAVNPTSIMGASKRICEMVVQSRIDSETSFAAVRFGNVLGSNGSVIPLFKRQISAGGPVTITDKRIIRYFMTIPEASQLVMQAGAMAQHGELFVLDMGKPIRIYDLAINMIKLSGFEPGKDIKIEEIGLRPGEKLYEELLMKSETLDKTDSNMIFVEKDHPLTREAVDQKIQILLEAIKCCKNDVICSPCVRNAMIKVVPTFCEADDANASADTSDEMKKAIAMF